MSRPALLLSLTALLACAGCGAGNVVPGAFPMDTTPNYLHTLGRTARWPGRTVTVRVDGAPALTTAFTRAAQLWSERTGGTIAFTLVDTPTAQVQVSTATPSELGASVAGYTEQLLSGGTLLRAVVRVDANLTGEVLVQALAHEMGHAIGVNGHSPEPADLMFYRAHLPAEVTQRDANTVRSIYGDSGRAEPTPEETAVRVRVCALTHP